MKRSIMQAYVQKSNEAVPFYQKAFGATLTSNYLNPDGTFYHAELDIQGVTLAVAERAGIYALPGEKTTGNIMQFGLHYEEGCEEQIRQAYEILREGATILTPLAPCDYSPLMADLIDQYGIRWCLFV